MISIILVFIGFGLFGLYVDKYVKKENNKMQEMRTNKLKEVEQKQKELDWKEQEEKLQI